MPITKPVSFKARLQRGNRVQIPKMLRWMHEIEPTQVLRVTVRVRGRFLEAFWRRSST